MHGLRRKEGVVIELMTYMYCNVHEALRWIIYRDHCNKQVTRKGSVTQYHMSDAGIKEKSRRVVTELMTYTYFNVHEALRWIMSLDHCNKQVTLKVLLTQYHMSDAGIKEKRSRCSYRTNDLHVLQCP
ncbi:hypothetical protein P7K49_039157 [Saguinus oedipus]|uniref:Uncharacterized protein n=1 Tax=Saguinus oedipus TaxID=9490 RepID=A0ABQ9TGP8_SAGOE|nr:hypothetical protein P7K49_039157 [Saguinus oedipus]